MLIHEEDGASQLDLVRGTVVPRLEEWCKPLGVQLMLGTGGRHDGTDRRIIYLQLPVHARSPRVELADQILADLCAGVAASFPSPLSEAKLLRRRDLWALVGLRRWESPREAARSERIEPRAISSDRTRWYGTCPVCGHRIYTVRDSIALDVTCVECHHTLTDEEDGQCCDVEMPIR